MPKAKSKKISSQPALQTPLIIGFVIKREVRASQLERYMLAFGSNARTTQLFLSMLMGSKAAPTG
jgi:hypothetical protein